MKHNNNTPPCECKTTFKKNMRVFIFFFSLQIFNFLDLTPFGNKILKLLRNVGVICAVIIINF